MGANTSLLKLCGEVSEFLVDLSPTCSTAPPRFILYPPAQRQLAVLAVPGAAEFSVKCVLPPVSSTSGPGQQNPKIHIHCTASHDSVLSRVPVSDQPAVDQQHLSFRVSLETILAKPGLHTVDVQVQGVSLFTLAVWVDQQPPQRAEGTRSPASTLPSRSPSATSSISVSNSPSPGSQPSLQYPFQSDGPQFRSFISHCENLIPTIRQSLKYTQEKSVKVADFISTTRTEIAGLISCVMELDTLSQTLPHQFHNVLTALVSALRTQLESFSHLQSNLQQYISSSITDYLHFLDPKVLSTRRKQYHDQAKLFYSYMGKNLSKADSTKLAKKVQFELQRFDYFVYLTELIDGSHARQFLYELSQFANVASNMDLSALVKQTLVYQKNHKSSKKNLNSIRARISNSKSFSNFSNQVTATTHRVHREGILWTYKGHGKSSGWHKQWVVLKGSILSEYSDWKTQGKKLSHSPLKLTFACIRRQDSGNDTGFEIITTGGTTRAFRAESKSELDQWLQALQIAVGTESNPVDDEPSSASSNKTNAAEVVFSVDKSNSTCCDCGATSQVEWISINLLCVVCINCSAAHRSLGAHVSKIRSLKLDSFTSNEVLELMKFVCNNNVNSIYEAELPEKLLEPLSSNDLRATFITDKYGKKKYVTPLEEKDTEGIQKRLTHNLIKSIHLNSIYLLQQCIAQGVDLNQTPLEQGEGVFQYSLKHYEGTRTHPVFFITEFLLLNGLQVKGLPQDPSTLTKPELEYWDAKAETNGVYNLGAISRSATISNVKRPELTHIDTSGVHKLSQKSSSTPERSENSSKRWSIGGPMPSSTSASNITANSKNRGIRFPKVHGGKT
ncbi:LADA_0H00782g1_1 [Lachancea dasiensis]|uniref:ADP-ribosylation factor GTPase-activating protein n=1 Tax=Lachancea dasiensis TaxID=1072105 RepID=A0A1G4JZ00_9SACH|nr:LADA_0H00782g1_1 [Lachancea dasiensis]